MQSVYQTLRHSARARALLCVHFLLAATVTLVALPAPAATTIVVSSTVMQVAADGDCSLVEAIAAANTNANVNECVSGGGAPFTLMLGPSTTYVVPTANYIDLSWGPSAFSITTEIILDGNSSFRPTITRGASLMRAFQISGAGVLTLRNVTISGFRAEGPQASAGWGGAFLNFGRLELRNVNVWNSFSMQGDGNAIYSTGTVNILDSSFSGNLGISAGSVSVVRSGSGSTTNIANTTFSDSGNSLDVSGAGAVMNVSHSTIAPTGAGARTVWLGSGGTLRLRGTIAVGPCTMSGGTLDAVNVAGTASCGGNGTIPTLRPLAGNGGQTLNRAVVAPSAAIDAVPACTVLSSGTNTLFLNGTPILRDQRGLSRDSNCDIGAFESIIINPSSGVIAMTVATPASQTLTSTNGSFPYTYAHDSGSLPPGISLGGDTISGTPTAAGTYNAIIAVGDSSPLMQRTSYAQFTFNVAKGNQAITFGSLGAQVFGAVPFAVGATASSGLAPAFSSTTTAVCTVAGNMVTIVAVGTCTVRASQAGDANWNAAVDIDQSFNVAPATQAINFAALANRSFGAAPFSVSATATSGLGVAFSSTTPAVCTVGGNTVTIVTAGTCTVRASQAGDANFVAAPNVDRSFSIVIANQTISFAALANRAFGAAPFSVSATATSGLAVTFSSVTPAVCTVASGTVTIVGAGTCTIRASQTGNINFSLAADVDRSFNVAANLSYSGPTATGTGTANVVVSGGGASCTFAPTGTGPLQSSYFIPMTGHAKSPSAAPPAGIVFNHGLFDFVLIGCTPGSTVTIAVTYPNPINALNTYWKFGPTPGNATPHWYQMPFTLSGNTFTFSITDGGLGDDDLTANGTIVDQGGPGVPGAPGTATAIPTMSEWMLMVLATLMLVAVMRVSPSDSTRT